MKTEEEQFKDYLKYFENRPTREQELAELIKEADAVIQNKRLKVMSLQYDIKSTQIRRNSYIAGLRGLSVFSSKDNLLWSLWKKINDKKEDNSIKYTKDEKMWLDYIKTTFFENSVIEKFNPKLIGCYMYNYGINYEFVYKVGKEEIQCCIPTYVAEDDYEKYTESFNFVARNKESENSWGLIKESMLVEEVRKEITRYLENISRKESSLNHLKHTLENNKEVQEFSKKVSEEYEKFIKEESNK